MRERRDPKFEVRGSKFRKPRTSDLEPSPVSPFPPVSLDYPVAAFPVVPDVPQKFSAACSRACNGFPRSSTVVTMSEPIPGQVAGEEPSEKIVIYWEREYSTASAPERLKLDFMPQGPLSSGMSLNEQRMVAVEGYKVIPDDGGPVRTVGQYGWLIRSPADCKIRRTADGVKWQTPPTLPEDRILGYKSFSGTSVDLILNSGWCLTRIIHERFCCNRGFAAATSLDAVGTASWQAGSPLSRSTYCVKYASLPRRLGSGACLAHSYRGPQPPCRIPTKGAHPLRNSRAGCYPASWLRAPVSRGDCAISRRTVINNAG